MISCICQNLKLVQNKIIDNTDNTFLGVMIDSKINWSEHDKYIPSKLSKGIGTTNETKQKRF